MVEANVAIINELNAFLVKAFSVNSERAKYIKSPDKNFTRTRMLPFPKMVMLILQTLKKSLSVEIQQFFEHISCSYSCTKQAFSKSRTRLLPVFFQAWNRQLVSSFYKHYGSRVKTWKGMVLLSIDGSTIPLPQTDALHQLFGAAYNQNTVQSPELGSVTARVCLLYDVLNGMIIKGSLHPYSTSEKVACVQYLDEMSMENRLVLFDRGYPSYWLMHLLMQKGANFIMRVKQTANKKVADFVNSKSRDCISEWYPSCKSIKKLREKGVKVHKDTPLKVRMVKVILDTGETEILVSNLYDNKRYTSADFGQVYNLRWGIETAYGYLKEELQSAQFSGIRLICIEQDFAANLFLFNLQSLIEKQCTPHVEAVSRKRKYRYKVNKNVSWATLKYRVVKLFLVQDSRSILIELEKLFGNYLEPVRPGRKYPRTKKRYPKGKYYTLTNYKRAL